MKTFQVIFMDGREEVMFAKSREYIFYTYKGVMQVYEVVIS